MLTTELIERILTALPGKTIGLVGDLFLDRYLDLDAARNEPSVETGLTAYQVTGVRSYPGALGTVLNNLAALGVGRIVPISIIGDDGEGYELMQELAKLPAVDASHLIRSPDRRTPTYTKPMLHGGGAVRELNRLDIKNRTQTPVELQRRIVQQLAGLWETFDALLVLDQVSEEGCGVISTSVRDWICDRGAVEQTTLTPSPGFAGEGWGEDHVSKHPSPPAPLPQSRERGDMVIARSPFVLADSREQIGNFRHVCVKPNLAEAQRWVPGSDARALAELVRAPVLLTRGEAGIVLAKPGASEVRTIPAHPVTGPIDSCGAGDSCSAAIACAMATGCSLEEAAAFGNLIASITVQQIGVTGTAPPVRVRLRWSELNSCRLSNERDG